MKKLLAPVLALTAAASPALAADGPFVSLHNTNFVVLISFLLFIAIVMYFGVPKMITDQLDKRSQVIKAELEEARALREEAQALLASYERKQKEVQAQAERIIANARAESAAAAEAAKEEIKTSVARRLASAEEQIASARAGALREVKDSAVTLAMAAAREVIAGQMDARSGGALIDDAITTVEAKMH